MSERVKRVEIPHQFINRESNNERKFYKNKREKRQKNWCGDKARGEETKIYVNVGINTEKIVNQINSLDAGLNEINHVMNKKNKWILQKALKSIMNSRNNIMIQLMNMLVYRKEVLSNPGAYDIGTEYLNAMNIINSYLNK